MTAPTIHHAAARALVRLPDGTTGRLIGIQRSGRLAKVIVGGRHRTLPASMLTLATGEAG